MSTGRQGAAEPIDSRGAIAVAAVWGAAEASFFFIVPDAWIGLVALLAPRRAPAAVAAAVAGAIAGALALFLAGARSGDTVDRAFLRLPGIRVRDVQEVRHAVSSRGYRAFLDAPLRALPVKLYVREAQRAGRPLAPVLAATALNRLARLVPVTAAFALIGRRQRRLVAQRRRAVLAVYAAGWTLFYALYWRRRRD